jgi:neopullulanase
VRAYPGEGEADHGYRAWWGLPALPKLNTDDPEVREYLFGVAEHWLRFGIDGWRLDVPAEIDDEGFWQEFRRRCRAIRPDAYLVGEIWRQAPAWLQGDRFDALMNYPLAAAILGFVGGRHLDGHVLAEHHEMSHSVHAIDGHAFATRVAALDTAYDPAVVAVQLNLLGSHDTPRIRTVLGGDADRVRLATLLQVTLPGAPCIYYGDEVGLSGGNDPACRGSYPWDPTDWEPGLRESIRAVIGLRRDEPVLRSGPIRFVGAATHAVAFQRGVGPGRLVVALNAGDGRVHLPIATGFDAPDADEDHRPAERFEPIELPGFGAVPPAVVVDGHATLDLGPRSGTVLRIR